jgi:thioredoxin 1
MTLTRLISVLLILGLGIIVAGSFIGRSSESPETDTPSPLDVNPESISSQAELASALSQGSTVLFLTFSAPWCGACRQFEPILKQAAQEFTDLAIFYKANTDQSPELAAQFKVRHLPTTVVFKNGKEVTRFVGPKSLSELNELVAEY